MTQDEAREEYNRQVRRYNAAIESRGNCYTSRNSISANIRSDTTKKINLEKYVKDIEAIIRLIDNGLSNTLVEANKKSILSNDSYKKAVILTNKNANIADFSKTFKTLSKDHDKDITTAYNECVKEKNRVNNIISTLENDIKTANARLNIIESDIIYYNNILNDASSTMNCLRISYNL